MSPAIAAERRAGIAADSGTPRGRAAHTYVLRREGGSRGTRRLRSLSDSATISTQSTATLALCLDDTGRASAPGTGGRFSP